MPAAHSSRSPITSCLGVDIHHAELIENEEGCIPLSRFTANAIVKGVRIGFTGSCKRK